MKNTKKIIFVLPAIYLLLAIFLLILVNFHFIDNFPKKAISINFEEDEYNQKTINSVEDSLKAAQNFTLQNLIAKDGFVYISTTGPKQEEKFNQTNSEAVSYALYWLAKDRRKVEFDNELKFLEEKMQHPTEKYLMWRLEGDRKPIGDGVNVATDADLRTIKALLIAEDYWGDEKYALKINELTKSIEKIGITDDKLLSAYGGVNDFGNIWKTEDIWLPYADFDLFRELAYKNRGPWNAIYFNMKQHFLSAQLSSHIYQTELTENRKYSTTLDGGDHSIHSYWMMVRASESGDKELQASAYEALNFYKLEFYKNGKIYTAYDSLGNPTSTADSPWVYALVGRAALNLADYEFSEDIIRKLLTFQETDEDSYFYGAFLEGSKENPKATQFTNQESIITLQTYIEKHGHRSLDGKVTA